MNDIIRPMRPADSDDVAALIRTAFAAQSVATDPAPSALRVTADDVLRHLAAHGGAVAEAGRLVGSVLWAEQDGSLYISRVAVAPAWRRRGIARALLGAAEAAAHHLRLPRLTLSTRLVLADNRRLFAACGFVETAQHAHPGSSAPTFVDMEKWLAPVQSNGSSAG